MTILRLLVIALIISLGLLAILILNRPGITIRSDQPAPEMAEAVPIGGPFSLVTHEGQPVTDADFRGKYMLIYFGYTYCPDVCPMELAKITRALDILEERSIPLTRLQPLFITVDPERDTVEQMALYVSLFHPTLLGLTGTPEQVKQATDAYRVYSQKSGDIESNAYLMDHASMVLLMGPEGQFVDFFSSRETAEDIAITLVDLLE